MSIKDKSTEYMYISARVRAIEANMPGRETVGRMLGADSAESAAAVATESGILRSVSDARNPEVLDGLLLGRLKDALETVEADEDGKNITPILRYAYDCANIKAALRCTPNDIDFADLLFDVGTLPTQSYGEMALSGDFEGLPTHMKEAAEKAKVEYAATGDPLKIDLPLDRACFADILDAAQELSDPFAVDYVKTKIDMTNVMIILRVLRMGLSEMTTALLSDALIDGGKVDCDSLREIANLGGEAEAKEGLSKLIKQEYPQISEAILGGEGDLENACDSHIEELLHRARYIPFGAPAVLSFLCELEYEIKNVRIILAGKAAGLSQQSIAQRVRGSYV